MAALQNMIIGQSAHCAKRSAWKRRQRRPSRDSDTRSKIQTAFEAQSGNRQEVWRRVNEIRVRRRDRTQWISRSTRRPSFDVDVDYEATIDVPAERERLTRDIAKYEKGLAAAERQLGNESFLAKAPSNVVEGLKKQESETRLLLEKARALWKHCRRIKGSSERQRLILRLRSPLRHSLRMTAQFR